MIGKIRSVTIRGVLFCCIFACPFLPGELGAEVGRLRQVTVAPSVFSPSMDETVAVSFLMERAGRSEVSFLGPDFRVVRSIVRESTPKGLNTVVWDGRDREGRIVPDTAYFVRIHTRSAGSDERIYDPASFTGGEKLDISIYPESYDPATGRITYNLPESARVRIRAGLQGGPMYKTILDWACRPAGRHEVHWDGWSEDRMVSLSGNKDLVILMQAYSLPENSIIVEGTGSDYQTSLREGGAPAGRRALSMDAGARPRLPKAYLIRSRMEASPEFDIMVNGAPVSGSIAVTEGDQVTLSIDADDATRSMLNQNRFECVVFVDDKRWDEVEYGYIPMTYTLDTRELGPGSHLVTVTLVTLTDQRASRSARIEIESPM